MLESETESAFLDDVVEAFGAAAKQLIAEAESTADLKDICYGALLAACVLHCEKYGVDGGRKAVRDLVDRIFDEYRAHEETLSAPSDATLH